MKKLIRYNVLKNKPILIKSIIAAIVIIALSIYICITNRNYLTINVQTDTQQNLQVFYSDVDQHKEEESRKIIVSAGNSSTVIKILNINVNYIRIDIEKNKSIVLNSIIFNGIYLKSTCNTHSFFINQAYAIKDNLGIKLTGNVDEIDPYISLNCNSKFNIERFFGTIFLFSILIVTGILILFLVLKMKNNIAKFLDMNIDLSMVSKYSLTIKFSLAFIIILIFILISANQVIFNNKSFIAPLGTSLIYSDNPSLPNYKYDRIYNYHGSDTGATMWQHIPYTFLTGNSIILDHEIPLWNRFNGAGRSLIGQGQAMIFEPLNLLIALTGFETWKYDLKYIFLKFVFAISVALILYILKCSLLTSVLIGILSIFTTFYFFRLNHPGFFTYAYSPLVLLSYIYISISKSKIQELTSIIFLIISNYVLMNSGTGKEAYISLVIYNFIGFLLIYSHSLGLRKYIQALIGCIILILISAPIWISFIKYILTQKSGYSAPAAVQFDPSDIIFFSESLGFLSIGGYNPSLNFPIFFLFILSFILYIRNYNFRNRLNSILLFSSIFLLFISYGLFPKFIINEIPFLNSVHHVNDVFSSIAIIPSIILAGISLDFLLKNKFNNNDKFFLIVISLLLILSSFLYSSISNYKFYIIFIIFYVVCLITFMYFIRILYNFEKAKRLNLHKCFLFSFILLLYIARSIQYPSNDFGGINNLVFVPSPAADLRPGLKILNDFSRLTKELPSRAIGIEGTMFSGYRAIYGVESIDGPDALFPKYFRVLSEEIGLPYDWYWRMRFNNNNIIDNSNALDFLNVGFIFSETEALGIGNKITQDSNLILIKRNDPWPRSFFTDCFDVASESESLSLIKSKIKNSNQLFLILDSKSFINSGINIEANCINKKNILPDHYINTSNKSIIHISTDRPGFLYLSENFEEDNFKAYVDGIETKIIRSNYAFKSVYIPNSGAHIVSFVYAPPSFYNFLKVSYLGFALLLLLVVIYLRSYFFRSRIIIK
jgi:hypothetical protein